MKFDLTSALLVSMVVAGAILPSQVARAHYDPNHGRWLQRDPAGYVDGGNLYEYARSRPPSLSDTTGLHVDPVELASERAIPWPFGRLPRPLEQLGSTKGGARFECQVVEDEDNACCYQIQVAGSLVLSMWYYVGIPGDINPWPYLSRKHVYPAMNLFSHPMISRDHEYGHLAIYRHFWDPFAAEANTLADNSMGDCHSEDCAEKTCKYLDSYESWAWWSAVTWNIEWDWLWYDQYGPRRRSARELQEFYINVRLPEMRAYMDRLNGERMALCPY